MAKVNIDGKTYEVSGDKNMLEVALSHGYDLPYFCWHPEMDSVGACRQCAVKKYEDESDSEGQIVMSCMEGAVDGIRISIKDKEASDFRSGVIEWLMTNHPHDCPTCDEGGECHLQDMTVMCGHNYRRYNFNKRTFHNQNLGPCLNHEMNRCIQCYRCVRFYNDFAGGDDLKAMASKNRVYFGRHEEGTLESVFSGNLAEVCPTGVFTDKTLKKHYTRKWDFTNAPSICHHCSLGCNIIASERYGEVRRIQSRYNGAVNGYFICDRGRFGYEHLNDEKRIRYAFVRKDIKNHPEPVTLKEGMDAAKKAIRNSKGIIGIGSGRASLESNYALQKMVGMENFIQGVSAREKGLNDLAKELLKNHPGYIPSMREVAKSDAVLILGEDLINTAPMLGLYVRQATRNKGFEIAEKLDIPQWHDKAIREAAQDDLSPLFIITSKATKQDEIARRTANLAPQDIARLGFSVANKLTSASPAVQNLSQELDELATEIAKALQEAKNPLVISGTSLGERAILQATGNISQALGDKGGLSLVFKEANSLGMAMLGGYSLEQAYEKVDNGEADTVLILENDLYRFGNSNTLDKFFSKCSSIISVDYLVHNTSQKADVILPAGAFTETDGTMVNNEGRAQRYYQVHVPEGDITESWRLLSDLMESESLNVFDDFVQALTEDYPELTGITELTPPSTHRINGQKIPRASHRFSGRTAIDSDKDVNVPKPPEDPDSNLSFTMEGYQGQPPSSEIPFFWSPGWNSQQAINKYQIEVGGPLHDGDPGKTLFEGNGSGAYYSQIPEAFSSKDNSWLFVPMHHTFGSEQLSNHAPAVQERTPETALWVNDADSFETDSDNKLNINFQKHSIELPIKSDPSIPVGIILYPAGYEGVPALDLPAVIEKKK